MTAQHSTVQPASSACMQWHDVLAMSTALPLSPEHAQTETCALPLSVVALQVLKGAAEKFPDFVASNLAAGVLEAFDFQSRLWAAKHPGQPLPKGEQTRQ